MANTVHVSGKSIVSIICRRGIKADRDQLDKELIYIVHQLAFIYTCTYIYVYLKGSGVVTDKYHSGRNDTRTTRFELKLPAIILVIQSGFSTT